MAEQSEKIIFGAEFEGQGVSEGVEELAKNLDNLRAAQEELKETIKETTKELKDNQKQLDATAKAAAFALNPDRIKEYSEQAAKLAERNKELKDSLVNQNVALGKVKDLMKNAAKEANGATHAHNAFGKSIEKLTSVNHLAAEGVNIFRRHVSELALGIVGGLAGGILTTVLPAVEEFIEKALEASEVVDKLKEEKKLLSAVFADAAKNAGEETAKLEAYKKKLNDTNIPAADRVKIAKEYNKTADETNQIDLKQIDNLQLINEKIEAQNKLILQRALSTAALAKLTEQSTKLIDAQLELDQSLKKQGLTEDKVVAKIAAQAKQQVDARNQQVNSLDGYNKAIDANVKVQQKAGQAVDATVKKEVRQIFTLIQTRDEAKRALEELADLLNPLITPDGLTTKLGQKSPKAIENVFAQKLAELKARLATVAATSFQSEGLIREKFSKQLDKEFTDIAKLLKEKKLTISQTDILKGLLVQINDVELAKGLQDFRKKVQAALKVVNDQLQAANIEEQTKRVNNIRDDFEREAAQIEASFQSSVAALDKRLKDLVLKIDADTEAGLISPAVAKRKKLIAGLIFGGLTDDAEQEKLAKQAELAFKKFQRILEVARRPFEGDLLLDDEGESKEIVKLTGLFLKGKIGYERYQKELAKISAQYSAVRKRDTLDELQGQLDLINAKLKTITDPKQVEQLTKQRDELRKQIAKLNIDIAKGDAENQKKTTDDRINQLISYANAIQQLASSVAQFWQQVNQAEAAALDRSIALQNKRVENAQQIAEKGNAEYLEMEQKRLDELTQKREDNARKQLAINNAVAASQAIVAAITAIAQAVETGSPLAAIAAVAAVIGAIGAAYNFVNSLQPQEANFFEGEEYIQGPEGRDKIRANLTKGERVVTAKNNAAYWDTLSAIHNNTIPPDVLNEFVQSYPTYDLPSVDFDRLSVATDGKLYDSDVVDRIDALNDTMGLVVAGLENVGIQFNLDENGFEAAIGRARKQRLLRKRS